MALRPSTARLTTSLLRARPSPPSSSSSAAATPSLRRSSSRLPPPAPSPPRRFYSTSDDQPPPAPPLLQKLRADLKTAMRSKDAARLAVLRSVLSAALNASKTATPIATDAQVVGLLRRTQRACGEAGAEFAAAGRDDLAKKEQAQADVLEGYAADSGVEEVSEDGLRAAVAGVVADVTGGEGEARGKARMGDVMKRLLAPGGPLDGKDVERGELARIVKEMTS